MGPDGAHVFDIAHTYRGICIHWSGVEYWNRILEWSTVIEHWNGALEWSTGMEYWNGVLDWNAGSRHDE
jgi:hypothetical protein